MPPRRTAQAAKAAQDSDEDFEGASDEGDYVPDKKKAKTKAPAALKSAKGKAKAKPPRGAKLRFFTSAPLDIIVLVMKELTPKDLLAMSRTCSSLRSILHSSGGSGVWKRARVNVGLEDIPTLGKPGGVTEWELASLLHDGTCHVCQKTKAKTVDLTMKVRACASCMRKNSLQRSKTPGEASYHEKVWESVPKSLWGTDFGFGEPLSFFWLPTVRSVSKRLRELKGEELEAYLKERRFIYEKSAEDKRILELWQSRMNMAKVETQWDTKAERKKKVKANLKKLGYTDVELADYDFNKHSLVDSTRELTDRAWTTAKPKLVDFLEEQRKARAEQAAKVAMKARANALRPYYTSLQASVASDEQRCLFPPFANFLVFRSVTPLWHPADASPNQADLNAARTTIMADAVQFGDEIMTAFFARLEKSHSAASDAETAINSSAEKLATLVTSSVECPHDGCKTSATFPSILDHAKVCREKPLTAKSVSTSVQRVLAIKHVLETVNSVEENKVNEASTSVGELYALGDAFECKECRASFSMLGVAAWSRAYNAPTAMNWSVTVEHILTAHNKEQSLPVVLPALQYTPPAPPAPGIDNPGGFVVDDE